MKPTTYLLGVFAVAFLPLVAPVHAEPLVLPPADVYYTSFENSGAAPYTNGTVFGQHGWFRNNGTDASGLVVTGGSGGNPNAPDGTQLLSLAPTNSAMYASLRFTDQAFPELHFSGLTAITGTIPEGATTISRFYLTNFGSNGNTFNGASFGIQQDGGQLRFFFMNSSGSFISFGDALAAMDTFYRFDVDLNINESGKGTYTISIYDWASNTLLASTNNIGFRSNISDYNANPIDTVRLNNAGTSGSFITYYDQIWISTQPDLYWTANGSSLGGTGTWNTSGANWATGISPVSGAAWNDAKRAVFADTAGTVTVDAVTVTKGILFATDGYTLEDGTITLGGADIDENTITTTNNVTATINSVLDGSNGLTKAGSGALILGGANTFSGGTAINAGALELKADLGSALGSTTSVSVEAGATLLLSKSEQVNNSATVTLSGGTIQRASGVSETFGDLVVLTEDSLLNYGSGTAGTLSFGTYTPSSLLTVDNFFYGNKLVFSSDLTETINDGGLFSFNNGFTYDWNSGTSTFTITAIPEPSTIVLALGLIGLMLWPLLPRIHPPCSRVSPTAG